MKKNLATLISKLQKSLIFSNNRSTTESVDILSAYPTEKQFCMLKDTFYGIWVPEPLKIFINLLLVAAKVAMEYIFSHQKSQIGYISEGLGIDKVGTF
jgi:hypothetical protein